MQNLLNFPQTTIVDKVVHKKAFYERSTQKTRLKDWLTNEFEKITWLYKLTAQTVNVAPGEKVQEVDVFVCTMKGETYNINPFSVMDEMLPRYTMFIIQYGEHTDLMIHYKEKTVVNGEEKWKQDGTELQRDVDFSSLQILLQGPNMDQVYVKLLGQVAKLDVHDEKDYVDKSENRAMTKKISAQITSLDKKMRRENQPRKKALLFEEIKTLKKQLKIYDI